MRLLIDISEIPLPYLILTQTFKSARSLGGTVKFKQPFRNGDPTDLFFVYFVPFVI